MPAPPPAVEESQPFVSASTLTSKSAVPIKLVAAEVGFLFGSLDAIVRLAAGEFRLALMRLFRWLEARTSLPVHGW